MNVLLTKFDFSSTEKYSTQCIYKYVFKVLKNKKKFGFSNVEDVYENLKLNTCQQKQAPISLFFTLEDLEFLDVYSSLSNFLNFEYFQKVFLMFQKSDYYKQSKSHYQNCQDFFSAFD